ncbi:MAG: hypothetical protein FWG63_10555 [Defluviitaleaceae bacterium]|nr:hypothetical protein [Defluviitaleaceae bacterium]
MLNIIIFLLFLIGVVFIVYSVIKFKPAENAQAATEETMDKLRATIEDADSAMEELSKLSQSIFDEMTEKYKELLYIYSLVDQKQEQEQENKVKNTKNEVVSAAFMPPPQLQPQPQPPPLQPQPQSQPAPQNTQSPQNGGYANTIKDQEFHSFMTAYNSANPKHTEIKGLAQKGMPIQEIAKSLNLGQGEVSLVLELGKNKNA